MSEYRFIDWDDCPLVITVDAEDPGDMGEPRTLVDYDNGPTTYVSVRALRGAVPEAGSREGLRAALERAFPHSGGMIHGSIEYVVEVVRAALGDTQEPRPDLDVERLARAHDDIVTMYARHEPGWDVVYEWHQDPGDIFKARAAFAAILNRAREYAAASPAAPTDVDDEGWTTRTVKPGAAPETREPTP